MLRSVRRRGKFLVFQLERDRIVLNLMLTGRLGSPRRAPRRGPRRAFVLSLRGTRPGRRAMPPRWTGRASWLPADDRPTELRYRDATRMGKVYLVPAGRDAAGRGLGRAGSRRGRSGADRRRLARADPAASGRAQEPAQGPGVRGRHRQRLLATRSCGRRGWRPSASGRPWRPTRSTRCTRRPEACPRGPSRSCGGGCRHASRSRCATSCGSIARAAARAPAAARPSARSRRAAS